jgi:hypothetical protein
VAFEKSWEKIVFSLIWGKNYFYLKEGLNKFCIVSNALEFKLVNVYQRFFSSQSICVNPTTKKLKINSQF